MTLSWVAESEPPNTFGTGPDGEQRSTVDVIYVQQRLSLHSCQKMCVECDMFRCVPHHAGSLDSLRQIPCVWLAPEHVTFETLRAAVHDYSKGVTVMANTQEGEEAHLALPERLLPLLLGTHQRNS